MDPLSCCVGATESQLREKKPNIPAVPPSLPIQSRNERVLRVSRGDFRPRSWQLSHSTESTNNDEDDFPLIFSSKSGQSHYVDYPELLA